MHILSILTFFRVKQIIARLRFFAMDSLLKKKQKEDGYDMVDTSIIYIRPKNGINIHQI